MSIDGRYVDGVTSRSRAARLEVQDGRVHLVDESGDVRPAEPIESVTASTRVANTRRFVRFADGAHFETDDNDGIDRHWKQRSWRAHRLESSLAGAAVAVLLTVGVIAAVIAWGIPLMAESVAFALPANVNQQADAESLALFDRTSFAPSTLAPARIESLQRRFEPIVAQARDDAIVTITFRRATPAIGANAFTLPAGTIVLTDQLVELAEDDDELTAVLAHEIGHAARRHGMRAALQATGVGLLTLFVVGDVSTVSNVATALPAMLTELGYSREFEREADAYAVRLMRANHIPATRLGDILTRLEATRRGNDNLPAYLMTHPPTPDRVARLKHE